MRAFYSFVLLVLLAGVSSAAVAYPWYQNASKCVLKELQNCNNTAPICIFVDARIVSHVNPSDYVVGDSFHYVIDLAVALNSTKNMSGRFNVSILSPTRELLSSDEYDLENNQSATLFRVPSGVSEYTVTPFETVGDYKLKLNSESPVRFIKIYPNCVYQLSFSEYSKSFDAMPEWEKRWEDRLLANAEANENLQNATLELNHKIAKETTAVGLLTVELLLLTIASTCFALVGLPKLAGLTDFRRLVAIMGVVLFVIVIVLVVIMRPA